MSGAWLSLVERSVRDREVVGSNPIAPINEINKLWLPNGSHLLFTTLSTTLSIEHTGAKNLSTWISHSQLYSFIVA
jgi:hypothetical protein